MQEIVYRENTSDDPSKRKPDITKAQTLLKWSPKIPLEEGLKMMVEDFRARVGNIKSLTYECPT